MIYNHRTRELGTRVYTYNATKRHEGNQALYTRSPALILRTALMAWKPTRIECMRAQMRPTDMDVRKDRF